jgi:gas vesicle protein
MNPHMQERQNYGFAIGLLSGTFVGAGLALWFAPRISELREHATESAKRLGRQASDRVGETVEDLARRGQDVRDTVADAVAHGAHEVERLATTAKTGRRSV